MKINWDGRPYDLDLTDIELKPAVVITGYMGMNLRQWGESLQDDMEEDGKTVKLAVYDKPTFLKSMASVYWLMLAQNGVECPIGDVNFRIGAFAEALFDAMAAEMKEALDAAAAQQPQAEPDPTLPPVWVPSPEPASPSQPESSTAGGVTPDG